MAKLQTPIQRGIYNTMLSAPTRSGKGVSSVIPTRSLCPGSVQDFMGKKVIKAKKEKIPEVF